MYIAAFVFAPLAALEPAPGSDFPPLSLDLTAVAPPKSRSKPHYFPVWASRKQAIMYQLKDEQETFIRF